jgi:hypothetical protein
VRRGKELVVLEVELVEPVLYLSYADGAVGHLAGAISRLFPRPSRSTAGRV